MAPYTVAVLIYPQSDILDFTGPLEIFSAALTHSPHDQGESGVPHFTTQTFAATSPVSGGGGNPVLTYIPDLLVPDLAQKLQEFDVLVVPGARLDIIERYIGTQDGKDVMDLLRQFVKLPPRVREQGEEGGNHRVLLSVCTGALFLGAAGLLAGRKATTHHTGFEALQRLSDGATEGGKSEIVIEKGKRWADSGLTEEGVQIVTAGGVSSGIDATLWVIGQMVGEEVAERVADIAEWTKRGQSEGFGAECA